MHFSESRYCWAK